MPSSMPSRSVPTWAPATVHWGLSTAGRRRTGCRPSPPGLCGAILLCPVNLYW